MLMDDNSAEMAIRFRGSSESTNYAFSGKVMLATVVILAVVCTIIAFFHMYSRWFLLRRRASTHHISSSIPTVTTPKGLDPIVLKSLSNFTYFPTSNTTPFECIICLGEFEEFETCRLLPKCNHCFHLECIDLWFQSHANCPLCRSPVQSESESPIGETADVLTLTVIVEVPVTDMGRDRVSEGEDIVSESERGNVFKPMEEPVRLLRRFLSI